MRVLTLVSRFTKLVFANVALNGGTMKRLFLATVLLLIKIQVSQAAQLNDFYDLKFKNNEGKLVEMSQFKDKVLLLANTASKCGYTYQYKGLEKVYRENKESGLVVIGFPSNDFGGQEPGSNAEIKKFCQGTYGVTFLLAEKVKVKGEGQHPVFTWLTQQEKLPGSVRWNFEKFLISKKGQLVHRFKSKIEPESLQIRTAIRDEINQ